MHDDMNIYCSPGAKVKFHARQGDDYFRMENDNLEDGKIYTVERTDVHGWSTDVYLVEVPGMGFNSVCFEEIKE